MPNRRAWLRTLQAIPDPVWTPMAAGGLMLVAGGLALLAAQPWLFPSLGPTAFLQAEYPDHRASRFSSTLIGHYLGISSGFVTVLALHAQRAPVAGVHQVPAVRVWAAALTVALTAVAMLLFRASHPPAIATALLIALGAFQPTALDAVRLYSGILLFAVACAGVRYVRRGRETPAQHLREENPP